ncbi:hypothetical protein [Streptomyces sp. enrichment culture]|uniref:hypothetical protein n=1 Tax=Streptomyces sp. enrichment culture TaxID=1795815 RepID=UPI003F56C4F4
MTDTVGHPPRPEGHAAAYDTARPSGPGGAGRAATLDQVVFRWAGNRGSRGAGISAVAFSCPEREARELAEELGPVLRVVRGGEQRPSIVRRHHRDRAVLLRRTPGFDDRGRDNTVCHALLGPPERLNPLLCLSLGTSAWTEDGWADRISGGIDPVPWPEMRSLATRTRGRVEDNVRLVEQPLRCLVAQFLRTPGGRVSAPAGELDRAFADARTRARAEEEDLPDPAFLALWGLYRVFGTWLGGADTWTFATFDTVDDHPHRVVFVPSWRGSAEEDNRLRRIDLLDPGTDEAARIAAVLVDDYLRQSPDPGSYRRWLDCVPEAAHAPDDQRLDLIASRLWPSRARRSALAPPPDAGGKTPPERTTTPRTTPDTSPATAHGSPPAPHETAATAQAHTPQPPDAWTHHTPGTPHSDLHASPRATPDTTAPPDSAPAGDDPQAAQAHTARPPDAWTPHTTGTADPGRASGPGAATDAGPAVAHGSRPSDSGTGSPSGGTPAGDVPVAQEYAVPPGRSEEPPGAWETAGSYGATGTGGPAGNAGRPYDDGAGRGGKPGGDRSVESSWSAGRPTAHGGTSSAEVPPPAAAPGPGQPWGSAAYPPPPPVPPASPPPAEERPAGVPVDRLTSAHRSALEVDALPSFLDGRDTERATPKRRTLGRRERRERAEEPELRRLVDDLTCAVNPSGHTEDLRHAVEARLDRVHHEDLLHLLGRRMPYAAQNIVLVRLPAAVRSDDAANDLLRRLLDSEFQVAPAPEEESMRHLHAQRVARMVGWFFHWLVEPRADTHVHAIAHYLHTVASDPAEGAQQILQELLVYAHHDRIPELPGAAWLAVVRALYERCGAPGAVPHAY